MTEEQENSEQNYIIIRGFPFPKSESFHQKNIEDVIDYVPKEGDVAIASYPKTGSTWMQYITLQIVSRGELFPVFNDVTYKIAPFLEMSGVAALEAIKSRPRFYKHHIPYNMIQKSDKSKCIYVYRNPEDTVVSFYYFINSFRMKPFDQLDFNQFFDDYLTGNIGYGSYFKHLLTYYEHKNDDNLLMISYEYIHANRKKSILRIAQFLGEEYYQCLQEDEDILNKVIENTSFDHMKKNLYLIHPSGRRESQENKSADVPKVEFFRKGIVGDGKNVLTDDQRERLETTAKRILNGTSVIHEWYPE